MKKALAVLAVSVALASPVHAGATAPTSNGTGAIVAVAVGALIGILMGVKSGKGGSTTTSSKNDGRSGGKVLYEF